MRVSQEALTFDDVLLIPARSEILPNDAVLKTRDRKAHVCPMMLF